MWYLIILIIIGIVGFVLILQAHASASESLKVTYGLLKNQLENHHSLGTQGVDWAKEANSLRFTSSSLFILEGTIALVLILFWLYSIGIIIVLIMENRNAEKTLAWIMVIVFLPIAGVILYIFLGDSSKKVEYYKKRSTSKQLLEKVDEQLEYLKHHEMPGKRLMRYLLNQIKEPIASYNSVELFNDGHKLYDAVIEEILKAKMFVHLEVYILRDDGLGTRIKDALVDRAQAGLEVRVLIDYMGSKKIGKKYIAELEKAGVKFAFFMPHISRQMNYRNHRKVIVLDGKVGFIGGFNIGDEYLGLDPQMGYWRDTHMKVKGQILYPLQDVFANDWDLATRKNRKLNENLFGEKYFPQLSESEKAELQHFRMQIVYTGLDTAGKYIFYQYFYLITNAKQRIWFTTPYLILPESIRSALKMAAYAGIDVRIIIPNRIDHKSAFVGSRGNVEELLSAGVRVYAYDNGFIHAKVMIVDNGIASVGTANMDIRSLLVNYEVNAIAYNEEVVKELEAHFEEDFTKSLEFDLDEWRQRSKKTRFFEGVYKLLSPLL